MSAPSFIHPGATVWAQCGSYGWKPAVVARLGRKRVYLDFVSGRKWKAGSRLPDELRPRDTAKDDKPRPVRTEAAR